jgi:SAM-dependent methyltransferase
VKAIDDPLASGKIMGMRLPENNDLSYFNGRIVESPLKKGLRSFLRATSRIPFIWEVIHAHAVRDVLIRFPGIRALYNGDGYETRHPFDRAHGTDTSGFMSATELPESKFSSSHSHFSYWGSQPSCLRAAVANLPPLETFTFIDLGCGKGRPLLVASEFPFRDIVGVELSPSLAEIARKNAEIMEKQFPDRTRVRVEVGDACTYLFPSGNLVLYLYNPFGEEILSQIVAGLEAALATERRDIYFLYFYPHFAACLDASPAFKRHASGMATYALEERGYGPVGDGHFVIWKGESLTPHLDHATTRNPVTDHTSELEFERVADIAI